MAGLIYFSFFPSLYFHLISLSFPYRLIYGYGLIFALVPPIRTHFTTCLTSTHK